jgi:gas vesicle protein
MSETSTPPLGADGRASPDDGQGTTEQVKDKATEVAGQAQEKAQQAADQAKSRAAQEIDQRSTQAGEQVATTAEDLRSVAEQLRSQGKDTPAKLAEQAADRAERVGGYLRDADSDRLLSDLEDVARRQPWTVVAGGMVLGFAAARFLKASSSQRYQQRQPSSLAQANGTDAASGGYGRTATPTEGIGSSGGRFVRPDATLTAGVTQPSSGV